MAVASHPDFKDVELVQFNSFGCGLDAISTEQTADILTRAGKLHTLIKIDEGKNNGAVKIRIRSLLAAIKMRKNNPEAVSDAPRAGISPARASQRRKGRVLLCPPLSNYHFQFLGAAFEKRRNPPRRAAGRHGAKTVELGLRYVNNDVCYPAMMVVGQFIQALKSGQYDPDNTDCLYAQTGGACRAKQLRPPAAPRARRRRLPAGARPRREPAEGRRRGKARSAARHLLARAHGD